MSRKKEINAVVENNNGALLGIDQRKNQFRT